MADVISILKPYAAFELIDPKADGNPYAMLGLFRPKGMCHALARKLIYNLEFQHDEVKGQYIAVHHESGIYTLHGRNLAPLLERWEEIHDLIIFDPTYHRPVTDSSAPVFTSMHVPESRKRLRV